MQVEPDHVVTLRLILRQPSSAWLTFSLEDIRVVPHTEPLTVQFWFLSVRTLGSGVSLKDLL